MSRAAVTALVLFVATLATSATAAAGPSAPPGRPAARAPSDPRGTLPPGGVRGVVLSSRGGMLTLLASGNALLTVVVAGTAAVSGTGNGRQAGRRPREFARASVVEVAGPRNSDGSLSAQTISVLFDAARAARAAGRITRPSAGGGFVLSDGTIVALAEDPWVFRGTTLLSPEGLPAGAGVTVYGTLSGTRLVARVIEVSL